MLKNFDKIINQYSLLFTIIIMATLIKFNILNISFENFIFVLFLITLGLIAEKSYREYSYLKKLGLSSTGNSTLNPTPGSSMLKSIDKHGYKPKDIKEIYLMSYSLSHEYLVNSKFAKTMKNLDFKFIIYGGGKSESGNYMGKILEFYKDVEIVNLNYHLIEHFNILHMRDGKVFVWYEPSHIVENKKDVLKNGGYLFVAEDLKSALNKFHEIVEKQKITKTA